jgi:hypothetical protein
LFLVQSLQLHFFLPSIGDQHFTSTAFKHITSIGVNINSLSSYGMSISICWKPKSIQFRCDYQRFYICICLGIGVWTHLLISYVPFYSKPDTQGILYMFSCGSASIPTAKHHADRPSALPLRKLRYSLPHTSIPRPGYLLDWSGFREVSEDMPERHVQWDRDGTGILPAGSRSYYEAGPDLDILLIN